MGLFLALVLLALVLAFFGKRIGVMLRREWEVILEQARADVERKKRKRAGADTNPIDEDEADELDRWYRSLARPALILGAAEGVEDMGFQLGGRPWLANEERWPVDGEGRPLEFIAQVDFAKLPPLDSFPKQGRLRFFIGRDDIYGANFDAPDRSSIAVLWDPDPADGGRVQPALELADADLSPFRDEQVRVDGLQYHATPALDLPDCYSCEVQAGLEDQAGRDGLDALEDRLFDIAETRPIGHRIGGQPSFTQSDFRTPGNYDDYDTLLLGLTSDDAIMWGDVGEAMFMIRAADLARRDFSKVAFYWDCH